jgi:hypothetical protein
MGKYCAHNDNGQRAAVDRRDSAIRENLPKPFCGIIKGGNPGMRVSP